MNRAVRADPRRVVLRDVGLVTLLSLLVYCLLSQDAFYRYDAWSLMGMSTRGGPDQFVHFLSVPLFAAARKLGAAMGLPTFESLAALSALSAAIAVGFHHLGMRIAGMSRPSTWASSALFGTCISVMFFATLIEHHALFLAFAACAFCSTAWLTQRPHWTRATLLGVLLAVSRGVHASGLLLPLVLLPWYLLTVRGRTRPSVAITMVALAALTMALVIPVSSAWLVALGGSGAPETIPTEYGFGRGFLWSFFPWVLWRELFIPYFPMSVIALLGLFAKGHRLRAMVLLSSTIPYALAALRIIPRLDEHGAYALPIALVAAPFAVRICGNRLALGLSAISLLLAVWQIKDHEQERMTDPSYAADVLQVLERPAFVMVAGFHEMDSLVRYTLSEGVTPLHLPNNIFQDAQQERAFLPAIPFILKGGSIYLTREADSWLKNPASPPGAAVLSEYLLSNYRQKSVVNGRFEALRLKKF